VVDRRFRAFKKAIAEQCVRGAVIFKCHRLKCAGGSQISVGYLAIFLFAAASRRVQNDVTELDLTDTV